MAEITQVEVPVTVISKEKRTEGLIDKVTNHYLTLKPTTDQATLELQVTPQEYKKAKKGETYNLTMYQITKGTYKTKKQARKQLGMLNFGE